MIDTAELARETADKALLDEFESFRTSMWRAIDHAAKHGEFSARYDMPLGVVKHKNDLIINYGDTLVARGFKINVLDAGSRKPILEVTW